jgi:hypothetical protein
MQKPRSRGRVLMQPNSATLSFTQTVEHRMLRGLMNQKFETLFKEVTYFELLFYNSSERTEENRNKSQSRYWVRDSNRAPPECKSKRHRLKQFL